MRRAICPAVVAAILGPLTLMAADDARKADEQAIRATAQQYIAAIERGDAKAALSFWIAGGDIVDETQKSRPAAEVLGQETKADAKGARPTIKITASSLRFLTADSAVEDGTSEVVPPGAKSPVRGHFSAMWVRQQNKWKLASLRESRAAAAAAPVNVAGELAALDWLVGDWTGAAGDRAVELSAKWNESHTFLVREIRVLTQGKVTLSANQRIGWDSSTRQIKAWTFDSDGGHAEAIWTRQGDTWIARSNGTYPDGRRITSVSSFTPEGKDSMIWRTNAGHANETAPVLEITLMRKGTSAGPAPSAAKTKPTAPSNHEAKKREILASAPWRRAMFELGEWLNSQKLYDKQQVERIKADFSANVAKMSAAELQQTLADLDGKFKILDSPQAQETRAWMAHYLSILSDKRRDEIVKKLPNFATMSAEELAQELAKIEQKRSSLERRREDLSQAATPTANPWDPGAKAAMSAYYRDHGPDAGQYYSPYRSAPAQRPFADVQPNKQDFGVYVGAYGGFGLIW